MEILKEKYYYRKDLPSIRTLDDGTQMSAYRGNNGTKCSIGCLIEDKDYHRKFEELDIGTILDRFPYIISSLQSRNLFPENPIDYSYMGAFLLEIQRWHDTFYFNHFQDIDEVKRTLGYIFNKWELPQCSNMKSN